jgi:hypothetical protein
MRVASWVFVACAALGAAGMFLPALHVEGAGIAGRKAAPSLFRLSRDRDVARRLLAHYRSHRTWSEHAADTVLHHAEKRAKRLHVDDARDAMSTLDDITDDDIDHGTLALAILVWVFVALEALAAALAFAGAQGATTRRRAIAAVVVAAVVAAIAIAIRIGVGYAVGEIDVDEIGIGFAPIVTAAAAVTALAAAVITLVQHERGRRAAAAK